MKVTLLSWSSSWKVSTRLSTVTPNSSTSLRYESTCGRRVRTWNCFWSNLMNSSTRPTLTSWTVLAAKVSGGSLKRWTRPSITRWPSNFLRSLLCWKLHQNRWVNNRQIYYYRRASIYRTTNDSTFHTPVRVYASRTRTWLRRIATLTLTIPTRWNPKIRLGNSK